jgi:hypothetical protein
VLIGKGVGGYPEQPGGEWSAPPFVGREIGEGFVKNLRGQIFSDRAVTDAAGEEMVNAFEMKFVERVEFRGVALSGLDEKPLLFALRRCFLRRSSDGHHGSGYSNCREREKVTGEMLDAVNSFASRGT